MAKARPKPTPRTVGAPLLAEKVADLRALAHPLRLRMLELFAEQPRTTKQVAELLGEPPTRLYHHVAALERAGLLVLKETRPNRGAVEKWYEAVARQMAMQGRKSVPAGRAGTDARRALVMTVLEQARQEMMSVDLSGATEAPMLVRLVVAAPMKVMPAVRARLLATVKEIQKEFGDSAGDEASEECERWALTMAFAPVSSGSRPKRGADKKKSR